MSSKAIPQLKLVLEVDTEKEDPRVVLNCYSQVLDFSHSSANLVTGSCDKFLRVFTLDESTDGNIKAEKVFEEKLDSELNHVSYSAEDDLIVATTNNAIYLYKAKKKVLFAKLELPNPDLPKRATFCL
jgi:WD40 repeat protein